MDAACIPGTLDEYAWAIPEMLRRTAALADGRMHGPDPAGRAARSRPWTPYALARTGAFAFRTLQAEVEHARAARPDEEVRFVRRAAGLDIGFRVIGRTAAGQIAHVFGHQVVGPAPHPVDVTVEVWDERVTGVSSSVRPSDGLDPYGMIVYSPDSRFISYQRPEAASWLDRERRHVIAWYQSAERAYLDQLAKPFNKLLFDPLRERGIAMAHAGLVARRGTAALIPGKSGSGKSTSSLACLMAGFDFLGDDYVGVEEKADGSFEGHALFASAVLEPGHLERFSAFLPHAEPTPHGHEVKSFLPLRRWTGGEPARSASIGLVLLPRIADIEVSRCRPASKFSALMFLAPPSLLSIPRPQLATFEMFVRLVERTPAYWLELGRDIGSIAGAVDRALEREALR